MTVEWWDNVELPIVFPKARCEACGKEDDEWNLLHFLHDGTWRVLSAGTSLRHYGFDTPVEVTRLYQFHTCLVAVVQDTRSIKDVRHLLMKMRELF